ncbi:MAG TPA: hypothetical protein GX000_04290, partial [Actinomyces sp.]|nr:hypothetical protein [Actinomyces sp.]
SVTVDGEEVKPNDEGKYVYPYGKTIIVTATPAEGYTFSDDAQTEWSWTAMLAGECEPSTPTTPSEPGESGKPSQPGKPGKPSLPKTGVSTAGLLLLMSGLGAAGITATRISRSKRS